MIGTKGIRKKSVQMFAENGSSFYRRGTNMLDKIKKLIQYYEDVISLPHKGEIARELRDEDDLFLLLLYSEMIGIPNPVFYYTLELYPYIIEEFHEWHLRMGMEKSPLTGIRCC